MKLWGVWHSRRRYFRKNSATGVRLFHVHVFAKGDVHVERHLTFRDFLIHHPDWCAIIQS